MKKTFLSLAAVALLIASCGEEEASRKVRNSKKPAQSQQASKDATTKEAPLIDKETMFGIIKSIPSPLETSALILELKVPYSERILNSTDKKSEYTTTDKQALNLGIYGADLGYVNLYEQGVASFSYLQAVRQLAVDLKIGQFFDIKTFQRMSGNSRNMDSLLYISQRGFEQMNNYLEKQGRMDVSAQLLLGGWIEGVYLSTSVYKTNSDARLMEAIGEQKVALDEISVLIDAFRNERKFQTIVKGFDKLKKVYDEVVIEYKDVETEMMMPDGSVQMTTTQESVVQITPEQIDSVTETIEELRKSIID